MYPIEKFVRQPSARLVWSKEIGRIEEGETRLVVTVAQIEDPGSVTRQARGIRIDVTNGLVSDQMWEEDGRLRRHVPFSRAGRPGQLPMVYGLGRTHNAVGNATGLTIVRDAHQYLFPGSQRPAELARLFLQALEELNAQCPDFLLSTFYFRISPSGMSSEPKRPVMRSRTIRRT